MSSLSVEKRLAEVDRLGPSDLASLVEGAIKLRAKRLAPVASERESELLLHINEGLPEAASRRLGELTARRDAETLTEEEHEELLRLCDRVEQSDAERVKWLAELAVIRNQSLPELMRDLGLPIPTHGRPRHDRGAEAQSREGC